MANNQELWSIIQSHNKFKRYSDTDYRLIGINTFCNCESKMGKNDNSPPSTFNPIDGLGHCKKCNKGFNFNQYLKSTGYEIPAIKTKKTLTAEYIYNQSTLEPETIKKYLKTRAIELSNEAIKEIGLKVNKYGNKTQAIYPIKNIDGKIVQIGRIELDTQNKKVGKATQYGQYMGDRAYLINTDQDNLIIFEGLEDALTYWTQARCKDTIMVTSSTSGFKHISSFLSQYKTCTLILDPDKDSQSLKASGCLGDKVKRLLPSMINVDANKALMTGQFISWLDGLKDVVCPQDKANELPFCFWSEHLKGGNLKLQIDHERLLDFLIDKGYHVYCPDKTNNEYIIIRIKDNIIEEVTPAKIRNCISNEYLPLLNDKDKISDNFYLKNLKELMIKGIDNYIAKSKLDMLPMFKGELLRDTKDTSYFFFKNGFIEVTANGYFLKPYSELPKPIWSSQCKDFDIIPLPTYKRSCNFIKFIKNICTQRKEDGTLNFDDNRYSSLMTVIGYLLSNYVDPSYQKAIILSDSSLDDNPEGGTGKGLLCNAIGKLRKITWINGKNINFNSQFAFQDLRLDTQIVWFDDVKQNFRFDHLFSFITENYSFEKKNQHRLKFTDDNNPKTIISTNFAIKGQGASHDRRKFEFELYNFYYTKKDSNNENISFTPEIEFKELFFKTWTDEQWQGFYCFMFSCVKKYLSNNSRILPYQSETLERKKLITQLGIEFVEFADQLPQNINLSKVHIFEKFKDTVSGRAKHDISQIKFGRNLKRYCEFHKLRLEDIRKQGTNKTDTFYYIDKN